MDVVNRMIEGKLRNSRVIAGGKADDRAGTQSLRITKPAEFDWST